MRPDSSDIASRNRSRRPGRKNKSRSRPLQPRFKNNIYMTVIFLSLVISSLFMVKEYDGIVRYIDRPITKIKMENQWQHIQEDEIKELVTNYMGVGFFRFDVNELKLKLEKHPWVKEVSIKRLWPESLGLKITEYTVIARWNENELLSQTGGVFQPIDLTNLKSLPRLFGPEDSESRVMEQYHAFNQILFSSDLKLTSLKLTARGSWDLMVNDSIKIKVGRSELVERLQRFKDFYERQKMADELVDVDLRYGNGIAIKRLEKNLTELATR